jgi:spoIIIJ-associated protein
VESAEASGKSIEDAILQALARLGRNRDEVDITVLQEPSRGTRGMGARDARVRVFLRPARSGHAAAPLAGDDVIVAGESYAQGDAAGAYGADDAADAYAEGDGSDERDVDERDEDGDEYDEDEYVVPGLTTAPLKEMLPEDASIEEFAVEALRQVLGHMGVNAAIDVPEPESEESAEEEPLVLNIRSDDPDTLSLLIGRRGETLSSLQLLVSLIVSKQAGSRERIIVDCENYRERREHNLRSMAARIADQVRRSGRPIMLEAMPPNERRIIHMALSETDDIATESTGEGDQRRVVVSLKRPSHV